MSIYYCINAMVYVITPPFQTYRLVGGQINNHHGSMHSCLKILHAVVQGCYITIVWNFVICNEQYFLSIRNCDSAIARGSSVHPYMQNLNPIYPFNPLVGLFVPHRVLLRFAQLLLVEHIPCGFANKVVSIDPDFNKELFIYGGVDDAEEFCSPST